MEVSNKKRRGVALIVVGVMILLSGLVLFMSTAMSFSASVVGIVLGMVMFLAGGVLIGIGSMVIAKNSSIGEIIHNSTSILRAEIEKEKLEAEKELASLKNQTSESKTCPGCGASKKDNGKCSYCGR